MEDAQQQPAEEAELDLEESITGMPAPAKGKEVDVVYEFLDIISAQSVDTAAAVVLAKHNATGQRYAIKVVDKHALNTPKKRSRLKSEIGLQFKCSRDSRVVSLLEVFETAEDVSMVMEYVDGGDLFDRVTRTPQHRFDEHKAALVARDILSAVCYLHSNNVVHRDLKPENVLCRNDAAHPAGFVSKVSDFGLAKALQTDDSGALSLSYSTSGTLLYCAPERLDDEPFAINKGVDVWSVGCIVFFMLYGVPPFTQGLEKVLDPDLFEDSVFDRITQNKLVYPKKHTISDAARQFLELLLEPDPHKRIGAQEAMEHAWIKKASAASSASAGERGENEKKNEAMSKEELVHLKQSMNQVIDGGRHADNKT